MRPLYACLLLFCLGACAQMPEVTSANTTTAVSDVDTTTRKAVSETETTAFTDAKVSEEENMEVAVSVLSESALDENEGATAPPEKVEESITSLPVPYAQQAEYIKDKIREYFPGDEMMICIAGEESTGYIHWLPDGRLRPTDIRNEDGSLKSSAAGVFQTLLKLHGSDIAARGLNMADIDDYMRFNRFLLRQNGYETWNTYAECKAKGSRV